MKNSINHSSSRLNRPIPYFTPPPHIPPPPPLPFIIYWMLPSERRDKYNYLASPLKKVQGEILTMKSVFYFSQLWNMTSYTYLVKIYKLVRLSMCHVALGNWWYPYSANIDYTLVATLSWKLPNSYEIVGIIGYTGY